MPETGGRLSLKNPELLVEACLIGGEWSQSGSGKIDVTNPATGAVIARVPNAGAEETKRAIKAAHAAFPAWRAKTANERAVLLRKLAAIITENQEDLAQILTAEQGKSLTEARGEVGMSAAYVLWFAEEARRIYGETIPSPWADRKILVTKEAIGVVAAITPWNFPSSMIARKLAPALAAGCPIVIKPASQTPLSGLAWGKLCQMAGIPDGLVSILTGPARAIGGELTGNPLVKKVTFTGSTEVGKVLLKQSAETVKKVSMELGGNAPFIVFDDADLDTAVAGAMASKFRNAGQTCVCANRILVQDGIHDRFVEKLGEAVRALRVGDGRTEGVTIGPLINAAATQKVADHLSDALAKGAKIAAAPEGVVENERFARPVVLTGATADMRLASEETFGPVAPIFRFSAEQEAIDLANATPFGLASYFYTEDLHRAWRVGEALEFGMVGLNTGSIAMEMSPFGGIKASGLGREGGREGIDEYLETKAFHWGGLKGL